MVEAPHGSYEVVVQYDDPIYTGEGAVIGVWTGPIKDAPEDWLQVARDADKRTRGSLLASLFGQYTQSPYAPRLSADSEVTLFMVKVFEGAEEE